MFLPLLSVCRSVATAKPGAWQELTAQPGWSYRRYQTSGELRDGWVPDRDQDNFWLRGSTLAYLAGNPQGVSTGGVVLRHPATGRHVWLTLQSFSFSAAGQVADAGKGRTSRWDLRRRLLGPLSFRVLVLGQMLTSGGFGAAGLSELTDEEAAKVLPTLADVLLHQTRGCAAAIIKDLYRLDHPVAERLIRGGFHPMPASSVMMLDVRPTWTTIEDYLADLSSKYRVRYRRARAKGNGLTRRQLYAPDIRRYQDRLYELYQAVTTGARFNAVSIQPGYFGWLGGVGGAAPSAHAAEVRVEGYFDAAGELVGFITAIGNGPVLHAHYLGMEPTYKHSHHLYHNMLYDLLELAIDGGYRKLDYGRTAMEIKSSVGATGQNYLVGVRARYRWLNRLIPAFTAAVYAKEDWTPRRPFRS